MNKCKPHHWRMPAVGDTGLRCGACGRHLGFLVLGEKQRADIVASVARRRGEGVANLFREAMDAARRYKPSKPAPRYPGMSQPGRRVRARKKAVRSTQKVTVSATRKEAQREALRGARQEAMKKTLADARRAARQGERPQSRRGGIAKPGKSFTTWFSSRRKR